MELPHVSGRPSFSTTGWNSPAMTTCQRTKHIQTGCMFVWCLKPCKWLRQTIFGHVWGCIVWTMSWADLRYKVDVHLRWTCMFSRISSKVSTHMSMYPATNELLGSPWGLVKELPGWSFWATTWCVATGLEVDLINDWDGHVETYEPRPKKPGLTFHEILVG